ncbi:MAG: hypothetical protein UX46_C0016G0001, partial [Candidatus Amesbacteria bacterium GW2011_GWC1_46_24]
NLPRGGTGGRKTFSGEAGESLTVAEVLSVSGGEAGNIYMNCCCLEPE